MNDIPKPGRIHRPRLVPLALATTLTLSLGACYVLPIDARTGQAYPAAGRDGSAAPAAAYGTAAAPVAPLGSVPTLLSVRLYPLNPQANKGGLLSAQVIDNNSGHGNFTVAYLGDSLQGESSRVDASYAPFGRIHQQVLGGAPRSFTGRRGIANAHGARGVNAQCEYVLTGPSAGTGVCQFSDGANYQMHFGG